jgi:hypothetical protein
LRDELYTRVLSGSRQLAVQYAAALAKLEDGLAASGDYEDALAASKRRLALEAIYSTAGEEGLLDSTSATSSRVAPGLENHLSVTQSYEIESLKQVFLRNLHSAREPVIAEHASEIESLLASPFSAGSGDYLADIKAEQGRTQRLLELTKGGASWRLEGLSTAGLEGFEDVANARYVDDPGNSGDRFKVAHAGGTHFIQLLWVRSPPVAMDAATPSVDARFFSMEPEDALMVGRLAAEWTRGYLSGKSLRLMLRPAAAKDGVIPALVFIGEAGLYQSMLLEYGFAALVMPTGGSRRPIAESALVKTLADRERAAREARPPAGIWALRGADGEEK